MKLGSLTGGVVTALAGRATLTRSSLTGPDINFFEASIVVVRHKSQP